METKFAVLKAKESLIESIVKDVFTLATVIACVLVSRGSLVWEWVTVIFAAIYLAHTISEALKKDKTTFTSKEELIEWAKRQDL